MAGKSLFLYAIQKGSPVYSELAELLRRFLVQVLCIGLLVLASCTLGHLLMPVLLGGLVASVPGAVFAAGVLLLTYDKSPRQVAIVFCVAEIAKLLAVAAAVAAVLMAYPDRMISVFVGFFAVWLTSLVTAAFGKCYARKC